MAVVSLLISAFSMIGSIIAVFLAARNPEVHIYEDADQSLSR